MTNRLNNQEKAVCATVLTSTFGKALDWAPEDVDNFMDLVDPSSTYPAPAVYAAVREVCATYQGYAPKPGDVNEALGRLVSQAVKATTEAAAAPPGLDAQQYLAWRRSVRESAIRQAFPPEPLREAVASLSRSMAPYSTLAAQVPRQVGR